MDNIPENDNEGTSGNRRPVPPGKKRIFRRFFYCEKRKRTVYASEYGLRAFPFDVDADAE